MKSALIYLNVGESAKTGSLVYSQQYENARLIKEKNTEFDDVFAISVLPVKEFLKNNLKTKSSVIQWKNLTIHTYSTWIKIFKLSSFIFKDYLLNQSAKKIIKDLNSYSRIVFHCRSYYAAAQALAIKTIAPNIKVNIIFDMRSFLPEEIAMKSRQNKFFYLDYKAWEKELIIQSDITFATTQRGINIFKMTAPALTLTYLPNCGFEVIDKQEDLFERFDSIWKQQTFGYVGSVGPWYAPEKIELALDFFKLKINNSTTFILNKKIKNIGQHPAEYKPWKEVPNKIAGSLFTLIPGSSKSGYLSELKVSMNFFSTKAAESLSLGIPLVVNRDITEVAEFIEDNNCGIVFDIIDNKIVIAKEVEEQLNNKEFWQSLHKNTLIAGQKFKRQEIIKLLMSSYASLSKTK